MHLRPRLARGRRAKERRGLADRLGLVCLPNHNDGGGNERADEIEVEMGRTEEKTFLFCSNFGVEGCVSISYAFDFGLIHTT